MVDLTILETLKEINKSLGDTAFPIEKFDNEDQVNAVLRALGLTDDDPTTFFANAPTQARKDTVLNLFPKLIEDGVRIENLTNKRIADNLCKLFDGNNTMSIDGKTIIARDLLNKGLDLTKVPGNQYLNAASIINDTGGDGKYKVGWPPTIERNAINDLNVVYSNASIQTNALPKTVNELYALMENPTYFP